MSYRNLDEIFSAMEETRARLEARAGALTGAQETFRPDPAAWSPAEIMEHLAATESGLQRLLGMMVKKAEDGRRGDEAPTGASSFQASLDRFSARHGEKFVAPENVRPGGGVSVAESLARLRASRRALDALRPRAAALDLSSVTYPHPVFGPLNFYEWLLFIATHEERHLRQMELVVKESDLAR